MHVVHPGLEAVIFYPVLEGTGSVNKYYLSETDNQHETKYISRIGLRCQNVVSATKDIIF